VGDFAGVVLADSIIGVDIVADCVAFVDTVSHCGDCGGGVSGTYKNYSISAGQDTRSSGEEIEGTRQLAIFNLPA
jgi:hypothetical protein